MTLIIPINDIDNWIMNARHRLSIFGIDYQLSLKIVLVFILAVTRARVVPTEIVPFKN